jgi:hypothetical protein
MPYFVYYITHNPATNTKTLEHVETKPGYREARSLARDLRAEIPADMPNRDCRLIFAKNEVEAEKLLSAPREERVVGED